MALLPPGTSDAIAHYGYGAVALAVGIESVGIPFPGETSLIAAAIYAGTKRPKKTTLPPWRRNRYLAELDLARRGSRMRPSGRCPDLLAGDDRPMTTR